MWTIYEDLIFNSRSDSETDILVSVLRQIPIPPKHRVTYFTYLTLFNLGKRLMSKVSQKSEVLYLRCINACQYGIRYLKYWYQGINSPLDPLEGQNFQCFIKSEGLLHLWGVYKRVQNIDFLNKIDLSTSMDAPEVKQTFSLYKTLKILTPLRV